MVDADNSSTKYIQGAGQDIQIIGNKAILRAPYCWQSCPVLFCFVCLLVCSFVCVFHSRWKFIWTAGNDRRAHWWLHHLVGKRGMGGAECSLGGNCAGLPGPRWVRPGAWWVDGGGQLTRCSWSNPWSQTMWGSWCIYLFQIRISEIIQLQAYIYAMKCNYLGLA